MNDAPERIWASLSAERVDKVAIHGGWSSEPSKYHTYEYVRADRIEALEAKLAKAVICLKDVIGMLDDPTGDEHVRDMRAAAMIARATLAELTGGKDD